MYWRPDKGTHDETIFTTIVRGHQPPSGEPLIQFDHHGRPTLTHAAPADLNRLDEQPGQRPTRSIRLPDPVAVGSQVVALAAGGAAVPAGPADATLAVWSSQHESPGDVTAGADLNRLDEQPGQRPTRSIRLPGSVVVDFTEDAKTVS
jgi:hypothetical protein